MLAVEIEQLSAFICSIEGIDLFNLCDTIEKLIHPLILKERCVCFCVLRQV